jgi:CHAD domain-containing protein
MTVKLRNREPGTLEARRIVDEHIGAALLALNGRRPSDRSIHSARKSIRKARAVWRLLQQALPRATYRYLNKQLRAAGQPLGAARDAAILVVTLDRLLKTRGGAAAASTVKVFRRALVQSRNTVKHDVMAAPTGLALTRRTLGSAHQRIEDCSLEKRGWSVLGKGMRRVYGRGRRMYRRARSDRCAAHLHGWRKQVKYLHHELAYLRPLWRGPIRKLADATDELSERLGVDHDLAILRAQVITHNRTFSSAAQQAEIIAAIEREREHLQSAAFMLGARIYAQKPADFSTRCGEYWHEWRRAQKTRRV